jgi:hypothetical protein
MSRSTVKFRSESDYRTVEKMVADEFKKRHAANPAAFVAVPRLVKLPLAPASHHGLPLVAISWSVATPVGVGQWGPSARGVLKVGDLLYERARHHMNQRTAEAIADVLNSGMEFAADGFDERIREIADGQ